MAVPKRRRSKQKVRSRRAHSALSVHSLVKCKNCGSYIPGHKVCNDCGYYKDRVAIAPKVKTAASE